MVLLRNGRKADKRLPSLLSTALEVVSEELVDRRHKAKIWVKRAHKHTRRALGISRRSL